MPRDMSKTQYKQALARHGFTSEGFMGYYRLPIEGHHIAATIANCGMKATRRAKLAYLLKELDRCRKTYAPTEVEW